MQAGGEEAPKTLGPLLIIAIVPVAARLGGSLEELGDEIIVKCIGIDDKGRVKLSRRAALEEAKSSEADDSTPEDQSEQPAKEEAEPAVS